MTLRNIRLPSTAILIGASLSVSVPALSATAHGGGLNAEGCHNNRKTGDYHCHRGPKASAKRSKAQALRSGGEYRNCAEARAAGAAPVRVGDPGYGRHLDRDNDGVGCE